jgi:uncharacterized protein
MDLDDLLTDEELDQFEQFLMSDDTPEECMDISMLDGFLTALVIGPGTHMPSQWLPMVWGATESDPMTFKDEAQAEKIMSWIMRYMNERVYDLQEGIDDYEPLIYTREHKGETVPIIDEWCVGFVRAMELDRAAWEPVMQSEETLELIYPILLYGTEEGWKSLENDKALEARHDEFAASLGANVVGIRDYWLPIRKAASTFRREAAKVGRNDACPCGSGKKFKKCCGSPERMH